MPILARHFLGPGTSVYPHDHQPWMQVDQQMLVTSFLVEASYAFAGPEDAFDPASPTGRSASM